MTCESCKYSSFTSLSFASFFEDVPEKEDDCNYGECKRNPPFIVALPGGETLSIFAKVKKDCLCGEFKSINYKDSVLDYLVHRGQLCGSGQLSTYEFLYTLDYSASIEFTPKFKTTVQRVLCQLEELGVASKVSDKQYNIDFFKLSAIHTLVQENLKCR